jgi:hypothetical protein
MRVAIKFSPYNKKENELISGNDIYCIFSIKKERKIHDCCNILYITMDTELVAICK